MTNKLCNAHCLYAIDGRCRLENRGGSRRMECVYYDRALLAPYPKIV